jgi:calcineurin-like phosphoesterase family protein
MINTWFISDLHFHHRNILEYEPVARPFSSLTEMHETIIQRWNSVVKPKDIVFILGDFCFSKSGLGIALRLNGKKRLVLGNHDTFSSSDYLCYFEKLYGVLFWNQCILSHIPVHSDQLGRRWHINVHGHLHSRIIKCTEYVGLLPGTQEDVYREIEDKRYFNVSCEHHNLTPVHADVILARVKEIKDRG